MRTDIEEYVTDVCREVRATTKKKKFSAELVHNPSTLQALYMCPHTTMCPYATVYLASSILLYMADVELVLDNAMTFNPP